MKDYWNIEGQYPWTGGKLFGLLDLRSCAICFIRIIPAIIVAIWKQQILVKPLWSHFIGFYRISTPVGGRDRSSTQTDHQSSLFFRRNASRQWNHCNHHHHLKAIKEMSIFVHVDAPRKAKISEKILTAQPILLDTDVGVGAHDMSRQSIPLAIALHLLYHFFSNFTIFFVFRLRSAIDLAICLDRKNRFNYRFLPIALFILPQCNSIWMQEQLFEQKNSIGPHVASHSAGVPELWWFSFTNTLSSITTSCSLNTLSLLCGMPW